ncbi:MAG TPA: iron-sulfur cluster repair di-iron protein [Fimbriimonadaceae bacterium]|nr:iron-sulfur cluster repair di-iron protein [Fimbriimonadaceae bacterium]
MNSELLEQPVGQLVAEQPSRSRVFERWGIDYCCGGKRALSEVCRAKDLSETAVLEELATEDSKSARPETDLTAEPLDRLCDHIVSTHHEYLREALPRLSGLTAKVAERHGPKDARLVELRDLFEGFRSEMESHLMKEERILFPAIRAIEEGGAVHGISGPVSVMLLEHDDAGADLAKMRELTDGFEPSAGACNTHRALLDGLRELEADTHQHVHKENNILFPRALAATAD